MIYSIVDYIFSSAPSSEDVPVSEVPVSNQDVECDGWVMTEMNTEEFAFVECPEIVEMDDEDDEEDVIELAEKAEEKTVASEAIRRREEQNRAKARKLWEMHMEAVMFADPISGKDVRKHPTGRCTHRSRTTTVVRRVNPSGGTQRAKKTSGKSNDRKVHKACDIQDPHA